MQYKLLPPVYFLAALLLQAALHTWLPLHVWLVGAWCYIGLAPIALGFCIMLWAVYEFHRRGTPVKPTARPTALVTDGPYQFTRNPMYIGLALILTGMALCLGSLSPLLLPPLFALLIETLFIHHEEQCMQQHFGENYRDFCRRVPRWM